MSELGSGTEREATRKKDEPHCFEERVLNCLSTSENRLYNVISLWSHSESGSNGEQDIEKESDASRVSVLVLEDSLFEQRNRSASSSPSQARRGMRTVRASAAFLSAPSLARPSPTRQ